MNMNKKNFKLSVIIVTVAIILSSCSKDDDNNPSLNNPTNGKTTAVFNSSVTYGTMTDQDSNVYKTVTIGTQTWMAENLRTTKYNDGNAIQLVTDPSVWRNLSSGAYSNYDNTNITETIATYGRLYNWYAVNTGKLAPTGWHIPTDAEWTTLTTYLGGESVAGGKLKEISNSHWNSPNTDATNETGFTALPGGFHNYGGAFFYVGNNGYWWSKTESNTNGTWYRRMDYDGSYVGRYYSTNKESGFSVRCVKD